MYHLCSRLLTNIFKSNLKTMFQVSQSCHCTFHVKHAVSHNSRHLRSYQHNDVKCKYYTHCWVVPFSNKGCQHTNKLFPKHLVQFLCSSCRISDCKCCASLSIVDHTSNVYQRQGQYRLVATWLFMFLNLCPTSYIGGKVFPCVCCQNLRDVTFLYNKGSTETSYIFIITCCI